MKNIVSRSRKNKAESRRRSQDVSLLSGYTVQSVVAPCRTWSTLITKSFCSSLLRNLTRTSNSLFATCHTRTPVWRTSSRLTAPNNSMSEPVKSAVIETRVCDSSATTSSACAENWTRPASTWRPPRACRWSAWPSVPTSRPRSLARVSISTSTGQARSCSSCPGC